MFAYTDSFTNPHYSADEPAYIDHSVGTGVEQPPEVTLFRSAFYAPILSPFTNSLGKKNGFIAFKILVILISQLLMFFITSGLSNIFAGSILTLSFQLLFYPYHTAMYIYLGMTIWLSMVLLLIYKPKKAGLAAGVLLFAFFIRMEQLIISIVFLVSFLCLQLLRRKSINIWTLTKQFAPAAIVFILILPLYNSSVFSFASQTVYRKGQSINWEIHDYLHVTNYYRDKYGFTGTRGELTEELYDNAYIDLFGKNREQVGTVSIPKLWKLNPELMKRFYKFKIFKKSLPNIVDSYTIPTFFENGKFLTSVNLQTRRSTLLPHLVTVLILLLFGCFILLRAPQRAAALRANAISTKLSTESLCLILAPIICIIPYLETQVYPHYFVTILPVLFLILAITFNFSLENLLKYTTRKNLN